MSRIHRVWLMFVLACQAEPVVFEADVAREVAAAYCEQLFSCGCEDPAQFGSEEACLATVQIDVRQQQLDANEDGLVYDQGCVQHLVSRMQQAECSHNPATLEVCDDCFVYHGNVREDEPCQRYGAFSDCRQGLACVAQRGDDGDPIDVCMPPCDRLPLDVVCQGQGPGFVKRMECEDGLYCDTEVTARCLALPVAGERCRAGTCAPESWCDATNDPPICAALKANGDGCDADVECQSAWCRYGERCHAPLRQGMECEQADRCALDLTCRDEICVPKDALVCQAPRTGL